MFCCNNLSDGFISKLIIADDSDSLEYAVRHLTLWNVLKRTSGFESDKGSEVDCNICRKNCCFYFFYWKIFRAFDFILKVTLDKYY